MKTLPSVDALIVGGGWAGLLMAQELGTRTPLRVVILERGGEHTLRDYATAMDELDYRIRHRSNILDYSKETITLRHSLAATAAPIRQAPSLFPGSGIGSMGEHWGAACPRFQPDVFELYSRTVQKYGKQRLPEGNLVADWGITWREMEPYYVRVERLLGVAGKAGNLRGKLVEGGNIFEGPRSEEYPIPPLKMPEFSTLFASAAKSLGYHPYPMATAILGQGYTNPYGVSRPACVYCGFCDGYPCMIGAKAQPTNTLVPVIQKQKNVSVRLHCWARRIVKDGSKVRGVTYMDENGEEIFQPAEIVILAAWTLSNVRLLLLSQIGEPYNPRTGAGKVGRNLTNHINIIAARAFFDKPLNRFMGAASAGIRIGDLDGDVFDHHNLPFLRGGDFGAMSSGFQPISNFGVLPKSVTATWGAEWKRASIAYYDRWGFINFMGEHLSYRENYMDLDPTYKDQFGDPLLRLTLDWKKNEIQLMSWASAKAVEIAKAMGAKEITPFEVSAHFRSGFTHTQGGAIMGTSPEHSVLNTYQQHWEFPNLFVVGSASFPQQGSGNPTPTILALAYRTADALIDKYLKSPGPMA